MATKPTFQGCYTALVTPFAKDLSVDYAAFEAFVDWQAREGVDGIVPCGTTGESPTLTPKEHDQIVEVAVKAAAGRSKVMAGAGSNSTEEAIAYSQHAEKAGADALLIVAPYYNKPNQEGIFQHYKAIAGKTGLPIFVYNIPGRSVINIADETLARLAEACPNIAGVKDATGDLARVSSLRKLVGDRLTLFSGEDITAIGFNAMGGKGVISVTSNVAPAHVTQVQKLTLEGKFADALKLHEPFIGLHQAMFTETSPGPVKYALSMLGICTDDVRLPLVKTTEATQKHMASVLKQLKVTGYGTTTRDCA